MNSSEVLEIAQFVKESGILPSSHRLTCLRVKGFQKCGQGLWSQGFSSGNQNRSKFSKLLSFSTSLADFPSSPPSELVYRWKAFKISATFRDLDFFFFARDDWTQSDLSKSLSLPKSGNLSYVLRANIKTFGQSPWSLFFSRDQSLNSDFSKSFSLLKSPALPAVFPSSKLTFKLKTLKNLVKFGLLNSSLVITQLLWLLEVAQPVDKFGSFYTAQAHLQVEDLKKFGEVILIFCSWIHVMVVPVAWGPFWNLRPVVWCIDETVNYQLPTNCELPMGRVNPISRNVVARKCERWTVSTIS